MQKKYRISFVCSCSDNRKLKIEQLKWLGLSVIAFVIVSACGPVTPAQQRGKMSRIGVLFYGSRDQPHLQSFQHLSDEAALRVCASGASLESLEVFDVDSPWQYSDLSTALRGLSSAGVAVRAIENSSEDA